MATEARYQVSKTPGAPSNQANSGPTLAPKELAEFIDSIKEDEAPVDAAGCNDHDPEYND
jgi:hypothetical protein